MLENARTRLTTAFFALVLLAGLPAGWTGAATLEEIRDRGTIRIAIADEEPYGYIDANGEVRGPGPDVARHVLEQIGIEDIEWVETAFSDLIPGLQEGRFDMAAAEMAILPERCEQVIYSEPNTTYGEGLLVRVSNPHGIRSYEDFARRNDYKVAVMAEANQIEMLEKLKVPDSKVVTIERNQEAVEAITSGRVDAYAATSLTASQLAQRNKEVDIVHNFVDPYIGGREVRSWGGFAFPRDANDLRDAFNEVLKPYKYTDDWEQTLRQYGFSKLDVLNSFKYRTEQLCNPKS